MYYLYKIFNTRPTLYMCPVRITVKYNKYKIWPFPLANHYSTACAKIPDLHCVRASNCVHTDQFSLE